MNTLKGIFTIPELKKKLMITAILLIVYRMGTFVTIPGIDTDQVNKLFEELNQQANGLGKMMGMVNMFSGGALSNASVFALGIMPYITASILFQILTTIMPALKQMQKDGESGRRKINQYTRYVTLGLCIVQSSFICSGLQGLNNGMLVPNPGFMSFILVGMICLTTGTMIVMWLGEMITEFGLGNGISIIIMAGIIAALPAGISDFVTQLKSGSVNYLTVCILLAFFVGVTIAIVYTTLGQRRIPIRQNRRAGGAGENARAQYLPLKVNMAGVIPIIFAQAIIMFPVLVGQLDSLSWIGKYFQQGAVAYTLFYLGAILFFCFFYTAMIFNPEEMSENMKQGGTFIPGIRPGVETQHYFEKLLVRITTVGALILAVIAIIPQILANQFQISFALAGIFGGTGLLIVVGVALDLIQKVEGYLFSQNFSSMLESNQVGSKS
ncbi:MAG: preprotein translocase subunit SecY [Planctomycetes bacterium]|nr:preprotein translocase subunit SecY [Planctomycetota bacterium]